MPAPRLPSLICLQGETRSIFDFLRQDTDTDSPEEFVNQSMALGLLLADYALSSTVNTFVLFRQADASYDCYRIDFTEAEEPPALVAGESTDLSEFEVEFDIAEPSVLEVNGVLLEEVKTIAPMVRSSVGVFLSTSFQLRHHWAVTRKLPGDILVTENPYGDTHTEIGPGTLNF